MRLGEAGEAREADQPKENSIAEAGNFQSLDCVHNLRPMRRSRLTRTWLYAIAAVLAIGHASCVCAESEDATACVGGPAPQHDQGHPDAPDPESHDEWCQCEAVPPVAAGGASDVTPAVVASTIRPGGDARCPSRLTDELSLPAIRRSSAPPPQLRAPPTVPQ